MVLRTVLQWVCVWCLVVPCAGQAGWQSYIDYEYFDYDSVVEAAAANRVENVKRLLAQGADINAVKEIFKRTALHIAVANGNEELVRVLIENGANVEARNFLEDTPLGLLCRMHQGGRKIGELLIAAGAETEGLFSSVCYSGNRELAQLLLENGSDDQERDAEGFTPLHCAASAGHLDMISLLLDRHVDIEAREHNELTPLSIAAFRGNYDVISLLIENGADIEAEDTQGQSPIFYAVYRRSIESVRRLIGAGAMINNRSSTSYTPLMLAALRNNVEVAKELVVWGADVKIETTSPTKIITSTFTISFSGISPAGLSTTIPAGATALTIAKQYGERGEMELFLLAAESIG